MRKLAGRFCAQFVPAAADREQDGWKESRGGNSEELILAAYLLWMTGSVLSVTMWEEYGGISALSDLLCRAPHFLLLLEFLQRGRYTGKDAAGVFLLIFTGIVSGHSVHNSYVIPTLLFVFFSARICFRVLLKATLLLHAVIMAVTAAASQTGIIEDVIWYEGERVRHSLGYKYCGYPAHLLLFMTLMWLCIRRRPRVPDAVFLLSANYLMYCLTDSRTDFYLGVLAVAGAFVWMADFRFRPFCVLRGLLIKYGAFLAAAGSIALHWFYNAGNPFLLRLNLALNNRLQFGLDAIRTYGFSLFGREIRWVGQGSLQADPAKTYNYVDCAFLKDGLSFGLLFLLLLLAGFYFTGKRLERQKRYMESWAVLVVLAYAVFNAHLCVLHFNVFILLLGENFSLQFTPSLSREVISVRSAQKSRELRREMLRKQHFCASRSVVTFTTRRGVNSNNFSDGKELSLKDEKTAEQPKNWPERIAENAGNFALTLRSLIPEQLQGEKQRRLLRTVLFLALIFYITILQCLPTAYVVKTSDMHMWAAAGILVLLAALCREEETDCAGRRDSVFWPLLFFLVLAGLSDLILNKRFRNAPFFLMVFGGLFCESWRRMRRPSQLLEEFRWACMTGFAVSVLYCIAARPTVPGIRYSGFLSDAKEYGVVMTVLLVVFLSGVKKVRGAGNSVRLRREPDAVFWGEILNGVGAVMTLYLIWLTQELSAAAAAAVVLAAYAVFWLYCWFVEPGQEKMRDLLQAAVIVSAGFAAVLLLRFLLRETAPALGTQIVYGSDENKLIKVPLRESLLSVQEWIRWFAAKWRNCKVYLKKINLTGHYYRAKHKGKAVWAASSLVMNLYRYGAAAGVCYGLLLPVCLWRAGKNTLRRKDFLPAGLAVSSIAAGMTAAVEMPFANLNWMVFYFVTAWLLSDRGKRQDGYCGRIGNEIFEHGDR